MFTNELLKPNLKLTFKLGSSEFTQDESGNDLEITRDIIIYASVKRANSPQLYQMPGVKITDLFLKGKVVTQMGQPRKLPAGINYELDAIAVLTEVHKNTTGRFRLIPVVQSRLSEIRDTFGERISGVLQITAR
ncbi:hypothetical protein NIES2100_73830 [Calothrix sp. NIES-2100]|uniref:hypothetical protein n=1 Tax=Calothrix sp. NIES-2100 TaxID=1954172 RepID=UPI000B5DDB8F|nr:hypothetical protein NIES2100_73830 [Calothrix sp. NIES-2100]